MGNEDRTQPGLRSSLYRPLKDNDVGRIVDDAHRILEQSGMLVFSKTAREAFKQAGANVDESTGWGDWADWYYYIYPDGVAVKKMHLWTHGERNHEWQESMGIFGPNQHPEDVIEKEVALSMVAQVLPL